jgi:alkanesulfonate monooxygenase SsuD/methylene tetrahydromethanopterin reductase-like flavin-dependent oxidoreductase (luciferase family)
LLLAQFGDATEIGTRVRKFKEETEACGRAFDPMKVGVTRAFHLTSSEAETREALDHHYHVLANNRKLSSDPNNSGGGVYRAPVAAGNADNTWLIGTQDQIVRRINSLKAQGVEYIMLLDTAGDIRGLERFAAEIAPIFDSEMASTHETRAATRTGRCGA